MATMALIVWPPSPAPLLAAAHPPTATEAGRAAAASRPPPPHAPSPSPSRPPSVAVGAAAAPVARPADIFLPEDMLLTILGHLTRVADVAAARAVCVRWRAAVDGCGGLWRGLRLPLVRRRHVRAAESWCVWCGGVYCLGGEGGRGGGGEAEVGGGCGLSWTAVWCPGF